MTRIVLDTDVVSHYRAGRLPAGYIRLVTANRHCIAFATAGELWKGALDRRWDGARRGALDLWLAKEMVLPAELHVGKVWGTITAGAQRRGRPRPLTTPGSRPAASTRGSPS